MVVKANLVPCPATRRDGQPCRGIANNSGFCMAHDAALADKRREAARLGGKGKARIARLGKLVPPRLVAVYDRLEEALGQVHEGQLDPRAATAMAALAGAMVKVLLSGQLEERVRNLEERQPSNNGRRWPR